LTERIYRLLVGATAGNKKIARGRDKQIWRWPGALISAAAAAAVIVATMMWPRETPCLTSTLQPVTERPSIAVLPLDNLSGDPAQGPIVDGFADELTTALAQIHDLFVIARNSAFAYRGKSCDMRRIAKELGVHNIIEGSVQCLDFRRFLRRSSGALGQGGAEHCRCAFAKADGFRRTSLGARRD
jgi:hypothetical protein